MDPMADRDRPELGPRKSAVLRAVVEEYVRTGEPVGSETIAEAAGLGVSSATIRNEMAALEELGYLRHPHTSRGGSPPTPATATTWTRSRRVASSATPSAA